MAGSWQPLVHQPTFGASTMLLLTDGTVMCQHVDANDWWKLTPDQSGSYVNGSWSTLANGPNSPLYCASAVLKDGRVFVAGGEYNAGNQVELLAAEIYNPLTNSWTVLPTPAGWAKIGDAPCCVLPDGTVLLGSIDTNKTAIYNPVANSWTAAANKLNASSTEETWTLLPDQTVLTADCSGHPQTQKYVIPANSWINTGSTFTDLVDAASIEIGPAILLPDGRVFAIGATNHTGLYTMPPLANQPGTWTNGPSFPPHSGQQLGSMDAPACLLPNGRVLCAAGPVPGNYLPPTYFFEFDPASLTLTAVPNPPNSAGPPYEGRMLLLPTGQVLFSNGTTDVEVYTPDGAPDPAWRPQITSCPSTVVPNTTYTLYGRMLNGLSQAVSYGDDASMATNYPIVRILDSSGKVVYCRTHDHSTMGIQTGTVIHSTKFTVPSNIAFGPAELCVIANGISSTPCAHIYVNWKAWKEIVKEINEKWLIKDIDIVKPIQEVKDRKGEVEGTKIIVEGDPWLRFGGDPELLRILQILAERSDKIEAESQKQSHFITEEERPTVGGEASAQTKPKKNPA